MRMRFIDGIGGRVTGSCIHFCYPKTNTQFLVDCGWQFEQTDDYYDLHLNLNPRDIKFVVLTHAHLDHSGLIPKLCEYGFNGKVYCTSATAAIAKCLLEDMAKHGNYDYEYIDKIDFVKVDEHKTFGFYRGIAASEGIFISFIRSSHVIGAASVRIWWDMSHRTNGNQILISGDVGRNTKSNIIFPLLSATQLAGEYPRHIVVESTYGHDSRQEEYNSFEKRIEKLKSIIEKADKNDKNLIIPAFAVQRTQDILFDLYYIVKNTSFDKPVRIMVDSRLSSRIMGIYGLELCRRRHHKPEKTFYRNKALKEILGISSDDELDVFLRKLFPSFDEKSQDSFNYEFEKIDILRSSHQDTLSKLNDRSYTNVVLTTSGMLNRGPILGFLERYLTDDSTMFLLTGYIGNSPISNFVRNIINNGNSDEISEGGPPSEIRFRDKTISVKDVKSPFENMSQYYSGHADQNGLIRFIFELSPNEKAEQGDIKSQTTVFINHGRNTARKALEEAIKSYNNREDKPDSERIVSDIHLPDDNLKWFDCNDNSWVETPQIEILLEKILNSQERSRSSQEKWFKRIFTEKSNQSKKKEIQKK